MAPQDCYAVLGVPPTASLAEVRRAFHEQARAWHPDKCDRPEAADRFRLVREAFEVLSDHRQRGDHDAALRRRRAPAQPFFSDLPRPRAPAQKAQAFASTLSDLLAYVDSGADGLSVGELRRCCSACELAWPNLLVERHELLGEISKRVRDELDRRVCAGEWARLTKEDLVLWLDARGVTLKYALECDSVDKEQLIRIAKGYVPKAKPKPRAKPKAPARAPAPEPAEPSAEERKAAVAQGEAAANLFWEGVAGPGPPASPAPPAAEPAHGAPAAQAAPEAQAAPASAQGEPAAARDAAAASVEGQGACLGGAVFGRAPAAPTAPAGGTPEAAGAASAPRETSAAESEAGAPRKSRLRRLKPTSAAAAAARAAAADPQPGAAPTRSRKRRGRSGAAERAADPAARKRQRTRQPAASRGKPVGGRRGGAAAARRLAPSESEDEPTTTGSASSSSSSSSSTSSSEEPADPAGRGGRGKAPRSVRQAAQLVPARDGVVADASAQPARQIDAAALAKRVQELRQQLEDYRASNGPAPFATVAPVFRELKSLDSEGRMDFQLLRETRIAVELNNSWWRRQAGGAAGASAAALVQIWMARFQAAREAKRELGPPQKPGLLGSMQKLKVTAKREAAAHGPPPRIS